MEGNTKKDRVLKCGDDILLTLLKKLASHWDANIFKKLRPPNYPYITATQSVGMYMWKYLIEDDLKEILKSLENGGNHGQKTE